MAPPVQTYLTNDGCATLNYEAASRSELPPVPVTVAPPVTSDPPEPPVTPPGNPGTSAPTSKSNDGGALGRVRAYLKNVGEKQKNAGETLQQAMLSMKPGDIQPDDLVAELLQLHQAVHANQPPRDANDISPKALTLNVVPTQAVGNTISQEIAEALTIPGEPHTVVPPEPVLKAMPCSPTPSHVPSALSTPAPEVPAPPQTSPAETPPETHTPATVGDGGAEGDGTNGGDAPRETALANPVDACEESVQQQLAALRWGCFKFSCFMIMLMSMHACM